MSNPLKILIVEDEYLTIKSLRKALREMDYEVMGDAMSALEAINLLKKDTPDLAILDIAIKGEHNGIWLAEYIQNTYDIPFIFLTAFADKNTVESAIRVKPYGYLVKPFQKNDIYAAIEVAISNYALRKGEEGQSDDMYRVRESIFIKDDYSFSKVSLTEITYIESSGNYLDIYTTGKNYRTRSTIKAFADQLPEHFVRCHRGFIANVRQADKLDKQGLHYQSTCVPISPSYKDEVMQAMNLG